VAALGTAAARGVDVRVLTNGRLSNHRFTWYAGRATYEQLLAHGVSVFEYQPTVLHAKLITVDGRWATIGSTNLDNRSLVLNDELNISVTDQSIVSQLDAQFEDDLRHSRQITEPAWAGRPWVERLIESSTRAFSGQL
jgi:cardiolipin synthase